MKIETMSMSMFFLHRARPWRKWNSHFIGCNWRLRLMFYFLSVSHFPLIGKAVLLESKKFACHNFVRVKTYWCACSISFHGNEILQNLRHENFYTSWKPTFSLLLLLSPILLETQCKFAMNGWKETCWNKSMTSL